MESNKNPCSDYNTGTDFWHDNAVHYGIDEAGVICGRYLDMQLKAELSDDEKQFCREIFTSMYEATADRIASSKLIYPYDFKTANERMETLHFHKSRDMNQKCARAIDTAINASNYKTNHYNLELAAISVVSERGFERVNAVLAYQIQNHEYDGRYSMANKKWATCFMLPDKAYTFMSSHATLIDDFTAYVRKLYADLGAERFALPGYKEHGEFVYGYEIIRAIMVDDQQGYAIGHNTNAVNPYVCWQFYIRNNEREYNWGIYGDEQTAVNGCNARLFVAFN